jgi:hypothetical protein
MFVIKLTKLADRVADIAAKFAVEQHRTGYIAVDTRENRDLKLMGHKNIVERQ